MTQGRPRKRSARAAIGPLRSRPAIGCEPRYRSTGAPSASSRCRGALFTLATSVTSADGHAASSAATTSAVRSGGTATTTRSGRSSAGRPAPRAVVDREGERRRGRVGEGDVDTLRGEAEPDGRAEQAGTDDADLPRSTGGHGRRAYRAGRSGSPPGEGEHRAELGGREIPGGADLQVAERRGGRSGAGRAPARDGRPRRTCAARCGSARSAAPPRRGWRSRSSRPAGSAPGQRRSARPPARGRR